MMCVCRILTKITYLLTYYHSTRLQVKLRVGCVEFTLNIAWILSPADCIELIYAANERLGYNLVKSVQEMLPHYQNVNFTALLC